MSISHLYNKTVNTKRLATVGNSYKEEWQTNLSDLSCAIQPVGAEHQEFSEGAFYKTFKMWCASDTDIQTGDKVISGNDTYIIKGTSTLDFGSDGSNHKSVILVLGK